MRIFPFPVLGLGLGLELGTLYIIIVAIKHTWFCLFFTIFFAICHLSTLTRHKNVNELNTNI